MTWHAAYVCGIDRGGCRLRSCLTGLRLQRQRSWLSTTTTVPSAGTPCRPRGNCPADIFSTSRDWCSVQGMGVLFVPGLQTSPSRGVGTLPQTGRGAGSECCGKLWAVLLHSSASSLYGGPEDHSPLAACHLTFLLCCLHNPCRCQPRSRTDMPVRFKRREWGESLLSNGLCAHWDKRL